MNQAKDGDAIAETLDRLRLHVRLLAQTLDAAAHPLEALIIAHDWGSSEVVRLEQVFEKWRRLLASGHKLPGYAFEIDFRTQLDLSFRDLSTVILAFYLRGLWREVCEAYVASFGDDPPAEYLPIARNLCR